MYLLLFLLWAVLAPLRLESSDLLKPVVTASRLSYVMALMVVMVAAPAAAWVVLKLMMPSSLHICSTEKVRILLLQYHARIWYT